MKKSYVKIIFFLILINGGLFAQVELVPVNHKVYQFLKSLEIKGALTNYNSSNLPHSRHDISLYLKQLASKRDSLNRVEKYILDDLLIEFNYDLNRDLSITYSFFDSFDLPMIIYDTKQKFLYAYADENASLFLDGVGFLSHRIFKEESFDKTNISLGELGVRMRGTLYNNFGFYLRMSNGQQIAGDYNSRVTASRYDPKLKSQVKFLGDKYFNSFEGYMRYESDNRSFALTFGRENLMMGYGYINKLFLSGGTSPFDFGRLDVRYKKLGYSFYYGNIRGDSLGVPLESKNVIGHRLDIGFTENFKLGLFESVIASNRPISFTYMNPLSFLISADFSAEKGNESNTLIGIDCELKTGKKYGFQFSVLIDDLNFMTLWKNDVSNNDNKFAFQAGVIFAEPLELNNTTAYLEYTRIEPFVYSHRTNKSTYAHWGISLGHPLSPNSDEIALMLDYFITNRVKLNFKYQYQRSGDGVILDSSGALIRNYGGDINRGDGDGIAKNEFLMGNRTYRHIFSFSLRYEPIRQYFIDFYYSLGIINKKYLNKVFYDQFVFITVSADF
jgi:hypothetical protein